MLTRKTINQKRQNKCTYVANDLSRLGVHPDVVYKTLLKRGVMKWLKARRDIIFLKDAWKKEINASLRRQEMYRESNRQEFNFKNKLAIEYERGYRKALEVCRKDVRAICHQSRWVADERDRGAREFLERLEQPNVANAKVR